MTYHTYILYNPIKDRYYIGSTGNLVDRLERHNQGRNKATKSGAPHWQLAYQKAFETRSEAVRWEYAIKRMKSRAYIQRIIAEAKEN